jgi:uncharacterized protein YcbX
MLIVSELFIYPIKSLGGISVLSAHATQRGLEYDRRWMLVDNANRFLSQREIPSLALLQVHIADNGLLVQHKHHSSSFHIPFQLQSNDTITVEIWNDICQAQPVSKEADQWFSQLLSFTCRLVYMPESTHRKVDVNYASNNEITGFSDGYPFLLVGQSSLDDLNSRLTTPLPINRFRPNLVFTGGEPFEEDTFEEFMINNISFFGVKLCPRCSITTTDQTSAQRGKEPLKTLSTYRMVNNNVYFGQNLLHRGEGFIKVGNTVNITKRKQPLISRPIA